MYELLALVCEEKGHVPIDIDPTGGAPWMGGPVLITICDRCGKELPHSDEANRFNNEQTYLREAELATSIRRCRHEMNGRQIPCPPQCPRQSWPESKFRRTIFGNWKLRKS